MSLVKMYITDSLYLNAEQTGKNAYTIHLSNGEQIDILESPKYNGNDWAWKIGSQYFDVDDHARRYLEQLITEKLTGKRVIFHEKRKVPEICGVNGAACRFPGECNRALCGRCPVAEAFFAERDGVELVYAV